MLDLDCCNVFYIRLPTRRHGPLRLSHWSEQASSGTRVGQATAAALSAKRVALIGADQVGNIIGAVSELEPAQRNSPEDF